MVGRRWLVALAAVAMLAVPAPATAAGPTIDDYVRQQQNELRIPGLAYAIVGRDGVIGQAAWGVDGQTPFLLGSVSKPFTALAVMRLVEAGRVGLDDPVQRHLPWFRLADSSAGARITVRQLLTHTSGLPQWASRTDRFDNTADGLARSVRDLATVEPTGSPAHLYSDANYMVLGALVEAVTGQPFGAFLRQEIFEPLGMTHAAATEADAERVGLPAGHRYWFGHPRRFDPGYDTSGVPYGYVAASLDDLVPFVQTQLTTDTKMHTGQVDTGHGGRYGLGWRDTEMDGTRVVWHAGATPGYWAHVVLVPGSELGVIVLANSYSLALDGALAAVGFNVARMALGEKPQPGRTDPIFTIVLYALIAVAVLLAVLAGRSLRARTGLVAAAGWVAGSAVLIAAVLVMLPAQLGGDLRQALLWTPDIGWAIVAVAVLAGVLAIVRAGRAILTRLGR